MPGRARPWRSPRRSTQPVSQGHSKNRIRPPSPSSRLRRGRVDGARRCAARILAERVAAIGGQRPTGELDQVDLGQERRDCALTCTDTGASHRAGEFARGLRVGRPRNDRGQVVAQHFDHQRTWRARSPASSIPIASIRLNSRSAIVNGSSLRAGRRRRRRHSHTISEMIASDQQREQRPDPPWQAEREDRSCRAWVDVRAIDGQHGRHGDHHVAHLDTPVPDLLPDEYVVETRSGNAHGRHAASR